MTTLVATDLDRTVVHSARVAGPARPRELVCLERRGSVATASLLRSTAATLGELARRVVWVPATTRSVAEYRRLDLAGRLGLVPRHAVCANGGVLLVDGVRDPAWAARIEVLLAGVAPPVEIADLVTRHLDRLSSDTDVPPRVVDGVLVVARARPAVGLDELSAECAARGWRTVVHGDKVHLLPAALGKCAAVEEVRRRVGATHLLAAGDSPLDAEMLAAADAGIHPSDGRLYADGWAADHVVTTTGTGVRAGHEIVRWLLARAVR
ncbi:HAD family hydrolase [Actinomycetospora endophytica]|uniref:HAD family hydrolase n=1 Tax=Actinomycetospora endophytica TaxID=2291215 RepID=A0ABS8PIV4_9PSEU|nr:HAD family hydrolase [Actinomycetospora endophytica]MCD2198186.1 HAD family hydrolase [Actinomycetospora endophytica]